MTFRESRYFLVLLIVTAVAGSGALRPARGWMPDPTRRGPWQTGSGWLGHHVSAHPVPAGRVVFSNVAPVAGGALRPGARCPGIVRHEGPSLVSEAPTMRARLVFPNEKISDLVDTRGRRLPNRVRTRVVAQRDPVEGSWHAIVHVSDGYGRNRGPADGRVEPAHLSSRRGVRWTDHGRLGGEVGAWLAGRAYRGSSLALVLDERPGAGVESEFVVATGGVLPGGGLALAVSDDGRSWSFLRDGPAGSATWHRPRSRTRRCTSRAWFASGAPGGSSRSTVGPRPATATRSPATGSFGRCWATPPSRPPSSRDPRRRTSRSPPTVPPSSRWPPVVSEPHPGSRSVEGGGAGSPRPRAGRPIGRLRAKAEEGSRWVRSGPGRPGVVQQSLAGRWLGKASLGASRRPGEREQSRAPCGRAGSSRRWTATRVRMSGQQRHDQLRGALDRHAPAGVGLGNRRARGVWAPAAGGAARVRELGPSLGRAFPEASASRVGELFECAQSGCRAAGPRELTDFLVSADVRERTPWPGVASNARTGLPRTVGCRWRDRPLEFGAPRTAFSRFGGFARTSASGPAIAISSGSACACEERLA